VKPEAAGRLGGSDRPTPFCIPAGQVTASVANTMRSGGPQAFT